MLKLHFMHVFQSREFSVCLYFLSFFRYFLFNNILQIYLILSFFSLPVTFIYFLSFFFHILNILENSFLNYSFLLLNVIHFFLSFFFLALVLSLFFLSFAFFISSSLSFIHWLLF